LKDKRTTTFEVVNFIGSIASITGISLLWLKNSINISPDVIVTVLLAVSFCFGLLLFDVLIIRLVYQKLVFNRSSLAKYAYYLLVTPILIVATIILVLLLGKVISSAEFKWLFRA